MDLSEKKLIDQTFFKLKRVLAETPSKARSRQHRAWLATRREQRRARIRQYLDTKPKPTALSEAEIWELAGLIGMTTKQLRQELKYVLLDQQAPQTAE